MISAGLSRATSNIVAVVWPNRCQPPGLTVGYTPVNSFAIATEPAVMAVRGVDRRGSRSPGRRPTRLIPSPA
jgi:hypothetical protein